MQSRKLGYFRTLIAAVAGRLAIKASKVGPLMARMLVGMAIWPKRDYELLAREGYQQNAVVNACISLIARSVADIPWVMYQGRGKKRKEIEEHPFFDLLDRPNPMQDGKALLVALISHKLITGNGWLERTNETKFEKMELYTHRPDRMRIVAGKVGFPEAYEYHCGGDRRRWEVEPDRPRAPLPILHLKTFNPLDDWYGQSPLDACAWAIDLYNGGSSFNKAILDNSGAPSGALVFEGSADGGTILASETYEQSLRMLRGEETGYGGGGNRMLLDGGKWNWEPFGLDPEKLQFIEGMNRAAREIAFALGVPPELVGIPGDKTYSNYAEARQSLYQETVIPLAWEIARALTHWFKDSLGEGVYLEPNIDKIDALQPMRKEMWERIDKTTSLTLNEKREAMGYEPTDGGDEMMTGAGQIPLAMAGQAVPGGAAPAKKPPAGKKPPPKKKSDEDDYEGLVH
jgi:HK97 family phage portal protein